MPDYPNTPVDPELKRQLESAGDDQTIEAVFTLRPPGDNPLIESAEVKRSVDRIIKSATKESGQEVGDLHVMPLAQCFSMSAPAGVVRAILENSEIASAMANVQPESLMIDPVPSKTGKTTSGRGKPKKGD